MYDNWQKYSHGYNFPFIKYHLEVNSFLIEIYFLSLKGKLKKSMAGLQIGHGRLFKNFRGYMDYVAVYLCRPSYL
jgi:hypothetical protein